MASSILRTRNVVITSTVPDLARMREPSPKSLPVRHPTIAQVRRDYTPGEVARYGVGGHSPSLRLLRRHIFRVLILEVLAEYVEDSPDVGIEMVLDRIMVRPAGDSPSKSGIETYHPLCLRTMKCLVGGSTSTTNLSILVAFPGPL